MKKITKLSLVAFAAMNVFTACSSDKSAGVTEEADGRFDSLNANTLLAWSASAKQYRVAVSGAEQSGSAGVWRYFEEAGEGGIAEISWPVSLGSTEETLLNPVIDHCQGICGKFRLKTDSSGEESRVGIGFSIEGLNFSSQDEVQTKLCVEYSSSAALKIVTDFGDDVGFVLKLRASEEMRERCSVYSRMNGGVAESIYFVFESDKDSEGSFNISKINWVKEVLQ